VTVEFQQSVNKNRWVTVLTITDPAAAGVAFVLPPAPYTRANITTYGSGVIDAYVSAMEAPVTWAARLGSSDANYGALTVTSLTNSGLTAGRVPIVGTAGLMGDAAALTYAAGTLSSTIHKGGIQETVAAIAANGAIAVAPGSYFITKGSALSASTLATPVSTTDDGKIMRFVSTTAFAHVISVASGKINGGAITTATFGGAIGDGISLEPYQGVFYTLHTRNVTLT